MNEGDMQELKSAASEKPAHLKNRLVRRFYQAQEVAILATGCGLALLLRYSLRSFPSIDFLGQTSHWYQALNQDGFAAFRQTFSNYAPLYLYLLFIVSRLAPGVAPVTAIKLPSIAFDYLAAGAAAQIVRLKYPHSPFPLLAFFTVLFAPTVVMNGSFWGQADILYTTLLLACLYFVLVKKGDYAMLAFGVALAFKLQAAFLAPFLLALLLKGWLPWRTLLWVPLPYLLSIVPAWLAGRPIDELLTIYLDQANLYKFLTANSPSMYTWFPQNLFDLLVPAGLVWAACVTFTYLLAIFKSRKPLNDSRIVQMALVSVLLLPFSLPKMHDRFFFPADVVSIVYAFFFPRHYWVAIAINLVSFFTYQPFLFERKLLPPEILSLMLLAVLVFLSKDMLKGMYSNKPAIEA